MATIVRYFVCASASSALNTITTGIPPRDPIAQGHVDLSHDPSDDRRDLDLPVGVRHHAPWHAYRRARLARGDRRGLDPSASHALGRQQHFHVPRWVCRWRRRRGSRRGHPHAVAGRSASGARSGSRTRRAAAGRAPLSPHTRGHPDGDERDRQQCSPDPAHDAALSLPWAGGSIASSSSRSLASPPLIGSRSRRRARCRRAALVDLLQRLRVAHLDLDVASLLGDHVEQRAAPERRSSVAPRRGSGARRRARRARRARATRRAASCCVNAASTSWRTVELGQLHAGARPRGVSARAAATLPWFRFRTGSVIVTPPPK